MGDANPIRTLGDYSKPSHEGYMNIIEIPEGNNVVPLRSDTIRLVQNGCSFYGLRSEGLNQHLKDFLKLVDSLDLDGSVSTWEDLMTCLLAQFFPPRKTAKLRNDILMFQQHQGEFLLEAWTHFKDLLQKVPHHGIDLWLQVQIFYDHVTHATRRTIDQSAGGKLRDRNAISLPQDVPSTSDHCLIKLEHQAQRLMEAYIAPMQPTQVNKITSSCEICIGPHDTQYCMKILEQAFVEYASSRTDETGADFKQQQSEMTNKIDTVLKSITDRIAGSLPRDTVKNPKLNVNFTSPVLSMMRVLALGWHLEEIHMTWAHLEKKQTRLRTYTKFLEDLCIQYMETASQKANPPPNNRPVLTATLRARAVQELHELQIISAFVDSRLESIEQILNNFANHPNETDMNNLESDDESVDTPLVSPFPHSDNESDDGEVLNKLIEYENVGMLRHEREINIFDGDDLTFQSGSESRPPMFNKKNYVPWSSRLLRYAKSRPNGKLIHNSILNGPYVRKMIPEPGDANRDITVTKTFHLQTDDELSYKELKQIEADDQAIQTILLGLPEDIYDVVDSYETAQEIWLRVQQIMKGSDIRIQEKKAKLFNEWKRFTSNEGESIESYYHRFLKLMNDLKRNKHFPEKIASNLKFLNNLQPEWRLKCFGDCEDVTFIVHNASIIDILFRDFIPGARTTSKHNACIFALAVMPSSVTM
uniref:Zinc finger, CCHC-type n=1 Tax=Tanacetum cinerariifolium TaxID=118510 RepID=A0A6L2MYP3_TANCI|nr:zinc finger, CCHC-type [Tanacetum cinerariifolium]